MPHLEWIGKEAVAQHHARIPFRLLRRNSQLSKGDADTPHMLVRGDNLLALKALLPYYGGTVHCIYIDPPYNTGNEKWVYNDAVNSPEILAWLGKTVGKESEDLSRHDKWLCMMYPRLQLLWEFLRDDGVIMVSIDDNEVHHLTCVLQEIFGPQNHLATLVWEKGKKGDSKFFSVTHEYVLVFARNKNLLVRRGTKWRRRKEGVDEVLSKYQEVRDSHGGDHAAIRTDMMAWYRSLPTGHPAKAHKHYNWSDDRGLYFPDNFHGPDDGRANRPRYDIIHPVTGQPCAKPSTGWRWEETTTLAALADNPPRVHFGRDHTTIPNRKSYLFEIDSEPYPSVFYKDGRAATLQLEQLLGAGVFDFPKDAAILASLIGMVAPKDAIILDSFGGSGTTAQAVADLNRIDGGRRQCILVELEEAIARDVTARRVEHAFTAAEAGGGKRGFSFLELGDPLFDESGAIQESVKFGDLASHVYFKATRTPLPRRASPRSPLLGVHNGTAVYLLYNGIMGDLSAAGGNVLTGRMLDALPPHDGPRIVYAEGCRLSADRLAREGVEFRQTPYSIRDR